jgi:hypothetical protein
MLYPLDDTLSVRRCFISPQTDNAYSRQNSQVPDRPCAPAGLRLSLGIEKRNNDGALRFYDSYDD